MQIKRTKIFLSLLAGLFLISCGGRLPSESLTTKIIRRHFNKYGKKYETSSLGNKKVINVEILKTEEIHKGLIAVLAFITMEGPEVFKVRVSLERGPFGWHYVAWENLIGG